MHGLAGLVVISETHWFVYIVKKKKLINFVYSHHQQRKNIPIIGLPVVSY